MQKFVGVVCALLVVAIGASAAVSAEDLAAAVKERRDLMKNTVAPAAKLGGKMVKGAEPFDAAKAANAAEQGKGTFTAAFNDMTKVCKQCHEKYREKLE